MKNIRILSENFQFLVVKFSVYFNRRVFVMEQAEANYMAHNLPFSSSVRKYKNSFICL